MLRYVPSVPTLVRVLSLMDAGFCQVLFMHLLRWSCKFYLFFCLWCSTLTDLCMLKQPCELGLNSTWLWCMIFFMCYWIQFNNILRTFQSIFIKYISLKFSLLVLFVWYWYQGDGGFIGCLWEFTLFSFLEGFEKVQYRFFFCVFGRLYMWSHLVPDFCLYGVLKLQIRFHFVIGLFKLSISSWFSFGGL